MYGLGSRSYNRSSEARENRKAQKEATERYRRGEMSLGNLTVGPICSCRSFELPHEISRHRELRSENDWRRESERRR